MYYSQHGEDFILSKMFQNTEHGYFVEIGCIDGLRFSNSLYFEQKGWKGMCIEPHLDLIDLLRKNRNCNIIEAAVGPEDKKEVPFYANNRGSLSSLDNSRETEYKDSEYFAGYEVQTVEMVTLKTLFKREGVSKIDFVSLDIEGYEIPALEGMDFSLIKPTVWVIESDNWIQERKIKQILKKQGYFFLGRLRLNLFFSLDKKMQEIFSHTYDNVEITHTEHPIDEDGDKTTIRTVKPQLKPYYKKIVKKELKKFYTRFINKD